MFKYTTIKRALYYDEVIRLCFELGYSVTSISKILPLGPKTIKGWITNFVSENKGKTAMKNDIKASPDLSLDIKSIDIKELDSLPVEEQIRRLKAALFKAEMRADLNDEIIKVAEDKFKIQIRKKAGAKQ